MPDADAARPPADPEDHPPAGTADPRTDGPGDVYAGALDHYTSPARRDWVKRVWEEPQLIGLLDRAVRAAARGTGGASRGPEPLRVLDVGCGTGVVLELLRRTPVLRDHGAPLLDYLGVDLDAALLAVAEQRLGDERSRFLRGDIRAGIPGAPRELYVSSGVPFSHLTRGELREVVTEALAAGRGTGAGTVLVIDVLGRYSLEWTSRWEQTRWEYAMSFFSTDREAGATPMSTYGGSELAELIEAAARDAGRTLSRLELVDRSIVVGRHTATGAYTPGLRDLRQLVNDLADPHTLVDPSALLLSDLDLPPAPEPVERFLATFIARWEELLAAAGRAAAALPAERVAAEAQPRLAEDLLAMEHEAQAGLGVGHSLTALVVAAPDG